MKGRILVVIVAIVVVAVALATASAVVVSEPTTPTPNYFYLPLVYDGELLPPTPAPPRETPTPAFPGGEL